MGGDTFEGVQKLTNQEFEAYVPQIKEILSKIAKRVEVYIPIPEKKIHGDIDFVLILQPQFGYQDILSLLKIERYLLNNNETLNTVYKDKQVDFSFVHTDEEFEILGFYKSYSGMGAYLGVFLSNYGLKLSTKGFYAIQHQGHVHYEVELTHSVQHILEFYGMSYETYFNGFKTRKQLFEYMRSCKFLDQKKMIEIEVDSLARRMSRSIGKLTKLFIQYLREKGIQEKEAITFPQDPKLLALEHFDKKQQFAEGLGKIFSHIKRKQILSKKFNANHLIEILKVPIKKVDSLKKQFVQSFESEEEYLDFLQQKQLEFILEEFKSRCKFEKIEGLEETVHIRKKKQKTKIKKSASKKEEIGGLEKKDQKNDGFI